MTITLSSSWMSPSRRIVGCLFSCRALLFTFVRAYRQCVNLCIPDCSFITVFSFLIRSYHRYLLLSDPEKLPILKVEKVKGISDSDLKLLRESVRKWAQELAGSEMIFQISQSIQVWRGGGVLCMESDNLFVLSSLDSK